ncbi:MAG: FGGY family carbohydrate kinase [Fuerstiella sp.]
MKPNSGSVVLGVDVGTTSVSVVAIHQSGQIMASITRAHEANVAGLAQGYAEQNPACLLHVTVKLLSEVAAICHKQNCVVKCIGLTGQMHGVVLLDANGTPLGNVVTWQDKRSVIAADSGRTIMDELSERTESRDMWATGCQLASGYLGTTVFAMQQLGQWPTSCVKVCMVADWIAAQLCARIPVMDRSHAASSGLYDLLAGDWSEPLLNATAVRRDWLPEVCHSGTAVGLLCSDVAAGTGLSADVVVCNAIGDHQAAVLSSLPNEKRSVLINVGTGGQIAWRVPEFVRVAEMETRILPNLSTDSARSKHGYDFMLVGAGLCGGDAIAWVNQTVRSWLASFGVSQTVNEVWDVLQSQLANRGSANMSETEGCIYCEPFFSGTRLEPSRTATLGGIGQRNFSPVNLLLSVYEGIARTMQATFAQACLSLADVGDSGGLQQIVMSGNASQRNPELIAAVAKAFEVPVLLSPIVEEAAVGAALLAGTGVDFWSDLETARNQLVAV